MTGDSDEAMMFDWWRSPLTRARRAARSGDWGTAAAAYHRHLARRPADAGAWVQLGHALKEAGDLAGAVGAYRAGVSRMPSQEDGWIHFAHLERRLGDREAAIAVLLQAIAACDRSDRAVAALVEMGARERLPLPVQQRIEAEEGAYAVSRYAAWRPRWTASAAVPVDRVLVLIDARGASPERLAVTRDSLTGTDCLILTDDPAAVLPYAPPAEAIAAADHLLLIEAGTRIAPDAITALAVALSETGAGAAYGDHDHWRADGQAIVFDDPCFQPMFDSVWFANEAVRPPCLLVTAAAAATLPHWPVLFDARLSLPVAYVHVPRLLGSRPADSVPNDDRPWPPRSATHEQIQVVIQTRDAPDMLERCIGSLRRTAARPDLLDIVIVDNRSVLPRTTALLADWSARGIARTIAHDAPFNWALANNLAAGQGNAPLLLFLNNDVEMESADWDDALRDGLAAEGVGVLGALLLYPDRLIQHAGIVFGMGEGGPVHEGVGHPLAPGGPAARWRRPRLATAVTGAWLATSRSLFETVGGFEERLPIAYNDVDFCLRCRAAGRLVVQGSHIVAMHRESATRGLAMSAAEQARDQADWAWMRTRWGQGLDCDPAYNPHWLRVGQPFDGLASPGEDACARWIAMSARSRPWQIGSCASPERLGLDLASL